MAPIDRLQQDLAPERRHVLEHPVYQAIRDIESLRVFMSAHVFAVWDFMCLLKTLQRTLTCTTVPWLPPTDRLAARLVNEIVLGEESDEVAPGRFASHFDLYLEAMDEVGADHGPIDRFMAALARGTPAGRAIGEAPVHDSTRAFVRLTLDLADRGAPHEVAAAFLIGREDLVPEMFRRVLEAQGDDAGYPSFRVYLERHIDVDEQSHSPMGRRLLDQLCGSNPESWAGATRAARNVLVARRHLWDGIVEGIQARSVFR